VLAVKDESGKLVAVATGYACHATVLDGYEWSGDYPAYYQIEMEKAHPGAIAIFWAGCGADQNPLPRRSQELAEKYGKQLASAAEAVLAGPLTPVTGKLSTTYREIPLAFAQLPTHDDLVAQTKDTNKYIAMRAKMLLEEIDAGKPLSPTYPYPVQLWRLGNDLDWFFLGGEVVVDFALRTKSEQHGTKTWLAGYSALLGPIAGIMIADYWLIRRTRLDVDALYQADGAYAYRRGWNPAALAAFAAGVLPNLPGFLKTAAPERFGWIGAGWAAAYTYAWFSGLFVALALYAALMWRRRAKT